MLGRVSVSLLAAIAVSPGAAIAQSPLPIRQTSPPTVATVLPANTPGVLLINTNPTAWDALNRFNPLPSEWMLPLTLGLAATGFNWQEEVAPWLGEQLAIAFLPPPTDPVVAPSQPVLLVPVKDTNRFNAFLDRVKARWGEPQIERDYKGTMLLQWVSPTPQDSPADAPATGPSDVPDATPSPQPDPSPTVPLRFLPQDNRLPRLKAATPDDSPKAPTLEERLPPMVPLPPVSVPPGATLPRSVTIALLPQTVAIATQPQALERLIDSRSEGDSLGQNPLFQRTLNHPQRGRSLLIGYGDIAQLIQYSLRVGAQYSNPSLLNALSPLTDRYIAGITKHYNTIDVHLWVEPEGIHSQTNAYYTTSQPALASTVIPGANQLLTRLPAATYLSANSRNFKQQWQRFLDAVPTDPLTQLTLAGLRRNIQDSIGLDPQTDLIPWMDGEYAFFLFPTNAGLFNQIHPRFNMGMGLMLQTSDRSSAEAAFKKLNQFVQSSSRGEVAIVPRQVQRQPVMSWEAKDRGKSVSILSYGWVSDDTVVITTGAGSMTALLPQPYLPLHQNPTFKTAIASLPSPNEGYFYVNMGASLALLYGLLLPPEPSAYDPIVQEVQRVLGSLRSISSTNSATPDAQRVDSRWVLAPARRDDEF